MKRYLIAIAILLIVGIIVILIPHGGTYKSTDSTNSDSYEYYYNNDIKEEEDSLLPDDLNSILNDNQTVPLDTNPGSITVLVNRNYLMPSTYTPDNLVEPNIKFNFSYTHDKRKLQQVAATALEKLFAAANENHYEFYGVSGYRSYERQKQIYNNNIRTRGAAATDSVSAKPGSSEHQTGLAIDISIKSINCRLDQALGDTPEGKWLKNNCHKFGYIIRYPKGKDDITGYTYEPWHIRYVGSAVASYLYKNKLTLEEYYGYTTTTAKDELTTGVDVENADDVTYATPSPAPKTTKKPKSSTEPNVSAKPNTTAKPTPKATKKPVKTPKPTRIPKPTNTPKPRAVQTSEPTKVPAATLKPTSPPVPSHTSEDE